MKTIQNVFCQAFKKEVTARRRLPLKRFYLAKFAIAFIISIINSKKKLQVSFMSFTIATIKSFDFLIFSPPQKRKL